MIEIKNRGIVFIEMMFLQHNNCDPPWIPEHLWKKYYLKAKMI